MYDYLQPFFINNQLTFLQILIILNNNRYFLLFNHLNKLLLNSNYFITYMYLIVSLIQLILMLEQINYQPPYYYFIYVKLFKYLLLYILLFIIRSYKYQSHHIRTIMIFQKICFYYLKSITNIINLIFIYNMVIIQVL